MKNMRLGLKIGIGFGCLILIACALGLLGVFNMYSVEKTSETLSSQYIPETGIANEIERTSLLTMYAMRGYSLSMERTYREQAQKESENVRQALAKAHELSTKYPGLVRLKADLPKVQNEVDAYNGLSDKTEKLINALLASRQKMDAAAAEFVESVETLSASQQKKFAQEIQTQADSARLAERLGKLADIEAIIKIGFDIRVKNFKAQAVNDKSIRAEALQMFPKVEDVVEHLTSVTRQEADKQEIGHVRKALAGYKSAMMAFDTNTAALSELGVERNQRAAEIEELAKDMAKAGMTNTQRLSDEAVAELETASTIMVSGLVAALLLCIGIALSLTRTITRPILSSAVFADRVAGGDLDGVLDIHQGDEVGKLADSLRTMVERLKERIQEADARSAEAAEEAAKAREAMDRAEAAQRDATAQRDAMLTAAGTLQEVAQNTATASEELSAQIEQASNGATQQSHSAAETATAMEEMNSTVLEVAKNASMAAGTADQAKEKALRGKEVVGEVVRGIDTVQNHARELQRDMETLGERASGIGAIMNVISDIADQTNLLALNAAIEAARAGDAGRGFAVVADEVRKLAEKTMNATKEVGDAVTGIQQGAAGNVDKVKRTVETIADTTQLANQSGEALNEIVSLADMVASQIQSIATASEQQSATSEEINRSIDDINRISMEASEGMRQSAQAISGLAEQSSVLTRLIAEMRGGEAGGSARALPA
ncbi:methyl-accepting chemotaxis sensory transducer [Solidesulfovibrio fructosivorans JJ]]|uniref:Methyl-accepting chemotaxis sensory transducer n=1 Tax=Solidesulfovibrio fructosivorans JJ] TaxID=596151 RepID=E1K1M1_SOLFR|nr:methyl-accepting chemotaxis protein [Solidesulfovibrio fructosivorans]EFL49515.1 methyl-accepting chemotaxis sensory transducer [Solidesulfovibrio fructosivorans JJ]]